MSELRIDLRYNERANERLVNGSPVLVKGTRAVRTDGHHAAALKPLLKRCGYTEAHLREHFAFGAITIPLVGFATEPCDFDSACIAVMDGDGDHEKTVRSCRDMGAPIVWVRHNGTVDWWIQHTNSPTLYTSKPLHEFEKFVSQNKHDLKPISVYRGKTLARVDKNRQLDFVDVGLLPLLREEAGKSLHHVVEDMVSTMLNELRPRTTSTDTLQQVFIGVFRLLAGKILKDKGVRGFKTIDLSDSCNILAAVAKHYNSARPSIAPSSRWQHAFRSAAACLRMAPNFAVVSPETLAYVYEHTLVSKSLRKQLGIHATPPWLVDYMVWQLYDWIREIPEDDRHVFEPACGHAPFLLSAMRILRLESKGHDETAVHRYLKKHLHGIEIDSFAQEIARLSLTLADIPNPNGWELANEDMYSFSGLKHSAQGSRVVFSNPPYEKFTDAEKSKYASAGFPVKRSKSVELLERILPELSEGSVFGFVLPQVVLHSREAADIRTILLNNCELRELCLFADKVFEEADSESVILLGRRRSSKCGRPNIRYCRVRESGVARFRRNYVPDSEIIVEAGQFETLGDDGLRLPELPEVWRITSLFPQLSSIADIGQGFSLAEKGMLDEARASSTEKMPDSVPAILEGVRNVNIWKLPPSSWLDPTRTPAATWRHGQYSGTPQVLVNYSPTMRGPWRIKALLDHNGHAVTSSYNVIRPRDKVLPIVFLWAILNSPLSNAFVYCHALKRHIYASHYSRIPLPPRWREHVQPIVEAARKYLASAQSSDRLGATPDNMFRVRESLLAMDATVLRAYDLPPRLERQVLDLFANWPRKGVGCDFQGYYPPGFTSWLPLHMIISESFQQADAGSTAARFHPGRSDYVREVLLAAMSQSGEI